MPTYSYTAHSAKKETISGKETASNEQELARSLHGRGYVLARVQQEDKKKSFAWNVNFGVGLEEKMVFMRNLKVMVASGVALPKILDVLHEQSQNKKFKKTIADIREQVLKGRMLSEAMEQHKEVFPQLFSNMVKAGEESGTLENVLSHLTVQLERQHELRSKIQGALIYPAVIVTAMIGIGILMLILVVPQLAATFEELSVELPLTTQFVIGLGTFLTERWYAAIALVVASVIFLFRILGTNTGKELVGKLFLRLPIVSGIVRKANAALTARTLSSLIAAGIPIVQSLEITATVVGNTNFKKVLLAAGERMKKGTKLSQVLREYKDLYPLIMIQMVEVGEETGQTGELLAKTADFFEEEVGNLTKNIASVIEPVLMLVIGAVVGFFAISMVQPMYSLLQGVK